jgi:hypothetical protein
MIDFGSLSYRFHALLTIILNRLCSPKLHTVVSLSI